MSLTEERRKLEAELDDLHELYSSLDPKRERDELDDVDWQIERIEARLAQIARKSPEARKARQKLFTSWRHLRWDAQKVRALEEAVRDYFG